MSVEHQDFKTVVFRKDKPKEKKPTYVPGPQGDVVAGEKPFKKISQDFKLELQKARQAKNWTHKDLANKIAVREAVIKEYENGKAIPNGNLINKLNTALEIKLPKCKRPKSPKKD